MTNQEAFNIIVRHMRQQGKRSMSSDIPGMCAYRGKDGTKCAVGALIPDEEYHPDMEGESVEWIGQAYQLKSLQTLNIGMLRVAQRAHDNMDPLAFTPEDVDARFASIAKHYGLTMPD